VTLLKLFKSLVLLWVSILLVGVAGCAVTKSAFHKTKPITREAFNASRLPIRDARSAMEVSPLPPCMVFDLGDGVKLEMVGVGIGSFVMGVPWCESMMSSMIGHKVSFMDPYWIGKFEITQEQFSKILGDCDFLPAGTNLPACGVSWDDAMGFADALNDLFSDQLPPGYSFTLPTEAQWEFACRAGHVEDLGNGARLTERWQRTFFDRSHRGESVAALEGVAWYEANSGHTLHPVGLKEPNAWGLYDMHGNVEEWCLDWDGDPHQSLVWLYYANNVIDQQGPISGVKKVLRGGGYLSMPGSCASWSRTSQVPDLNVRETMGFRIAIARPAQELPDVQDRAVYGKSKVTEDMEFLHAVTTGRLQREVPEEMRNQAKFTAERRAEAQAAIERRHRTLAVLETAKAGLEIARPEIEYQIRRGVRASFGQKVDKPWEGFAERMADEWGLSEDGVELAEGDVAAHGNGKGDDGKCPKGLPTIKGKSTLKECESSTYQLYIGGTKITSGVEWAPAGTSITVSNAGSHARAMAGNPPIRSGLFKTGIKATYNGKTYRKWISIRKTGKSATVNKYKNRKR